MRKRRLRTFAAGLTAAGLLTALPVVGAAPVVSAVAAPAGVAADAQPKSASEQAAASGEPVEVTAERTEYGTTYAEPDGTYTLRESAVPVRVKTAAGGWTAPDATLQHRADGSVGPAASVAEVAFSGGGSSTPLVTVGSEGKSLSLTWPGTLPAPTLDGDSAVYADVLPGVDLRMTATVTGYRELLVVKTPQAAANPDLARIAFGLDSTGLVVTRTAGGGVGAVDDNGRQVLVYPPAQMWDSRGTADSSAAKSSSKSAKAGQSPADASPPENAVDGPAPGAGTATVPIDVSPTTLAVEPDPGLLAQTDSAAFPLYLDPDPELNPQAPERTLLRSDGYSDYAFDNTATDGTPSGKGDGKCGTWNGYYCGSGYVQRLYYQFGPGPLAGKTVMSAYFTVTSQWAFQCQDRTSDLVRTNNISASTTWASRPKELDWMVDESFSAGRGSSCNPDAPSAQIEFADNAAQSFENLTPTVRDFAAGKFAKLTLELRAHDEGDASAWKRFENDGTLVVNYIGRPLPPTNTGIKRGTSVTCRTNPADPDVTADTKPILAARVRVAEGGSPADNSARLRADIVVQREYAAGTWGTLEEPIRPSPTSFADDKELVYDESPAALSEGVSYRMAASTWSYETTSQTHIDSHSTVTTAGWCYFRVDTTGPKPPRIFVNGPYTECTTNDCQSKGGPGIPGSFTFAPALGDSPIAGYMYELGSGAWVTKMLDKDRIVPPGQEEWLTVGDITPIGAGTQVLSIKALDDVGTGRTGAESDLPFKVAEGEPPIGQWHFDDTASGGTSATAADTATGPGSRHTATLHTDGAGWSLMGRRGDGDGSLWLNDSSSPTQETGYAATQTPVVNTKSSFTVSAWVYLSNNSQYQTVMAQTGSDNSGFALRYSPGSRSWQVLWSWNSGGARQYAAVNSAVTNVPVKVWTHLAFSYDVSTHTLGLYVNGKPASTSVKLPAAAALQTPDGALQFGRASYTSNSTFTDYLHGRLDELEVWQYALKDSEIALDAQLLAPLTAPGGPAGDPAVENVVNWNMSGASGTTVTDATTGYGHVLTTTGTGQLDGDALVLNGSNAAATPGPVIDESGSFTVTTLAQPDNAKVLADWADGDSAQVLGQRSADGSAWGLWYQRTGWTTVPDDAGDDVKVPTTRWLFGKIDSGDTFTGAASEPGPASGSTGNGSDSGGAVRVTGVYDALSGKATLYMSDVFQEARPFTAAMGSTDFAVGRPFVTGVWVHYLPGSVQEIRIWSGAMKDTDQVSTVVGH
ncbi:LamG domain-containing protein [Streptomyces sp. CA-111067]|uniref:LamG domain-containing protein n=1 Tax=Streptomyces sp. CA-111067 TaxID=3240046 RepID=UPI003D9774E6